MSSSILGPPKKSRNIRGVKLSAASLKPAATTDGGDKRRSTASDASGSTLSLQSDSASSSSPSLPSSASNRSSMTDQLASLELGLEFQIDVRPEDLQVIAELGAGAGGTVSKVKHVPTGATMARKIVHVEAKPSVRKQILREVQIMHDCNSPYIVSFYGAALEGPQIHMCLEYMDKGSLDSIYKATGPIEIDILGKITFAVVAGLTYLYSSHRIIHRDVKPSNILLNSHGQVKLCDFGVSGELINSVADTFVGTSTYMSPERIQGAAYTVRSDVWSLGITLIELALGRFPFADEAEGEDEGGARDDATRTERERTLSPVRARTLQSQRPNPVMSIIDQLQHIVNEEAPVLPAASFPADACAFTALCLLKDVDQRPTPKELLKHPWLVEAKTADVNLEQWASTLP